MAIDWPDSPTEGQAFRADDTWHRYTGGAWRKITADGIVNATADHGVLGDGTSDDTARMQAAVDATPIGGICVFPLTPAAGSMRISAPINLLEQRTYVFPLAGRMWPYRYTPPIAGSVKLTAGFAGAAAFLVQGNEITARALDNDGIRVVGLVVDCGAAAGNMDGILVEGLCRDLSFADCAVFNAQGTGNGFHFRAGAGEGPPRGVRMDHCSAYACDANGFRFNAVTDSNFHDLLGVGNGQRGLYITNSGENSFVSCRAVFNVTDGFFLDGTTTVGMTTLVAPATDRNGQNGILISQSGTQPIQIVAPRLRRDGSSSTSSNYSGLRLSGSAGLEVVPVDVTIPQVLPGVDDGGGGSQTPQWAVRALRAQRLTIHGGDLWGVSGGFSDGGNNGIVEWTADTYWAAGAIGAKARVSPTMIGPSELLNGRTMTDVGAPAAADLILLRDVSDGSTLKVAQFSEFGGGGATNASGIAFEPAGTIAATDVQAAIEEVAAEAGSGGASAAEDVTFTPAGTIAATDTQAAVEEVATDAASALSTHAADTTSVHGIADTATLYAAGGTDVAVADGGTGASTAAAARTNLDVQRRIGFDVHDYGAVGDGTTDDSVAILAACTAAGTGTVLLGPHTYNVDTGLSLSGMSCSIVGHDEATVFYAENQSGPVLDLTGYSYPASVQYIRTFEGFTVKGNGAADATKANTGITADDLGGMRLSRIAIIDTGGPCLDLTTVQLCQFDHVVCNRPVGADTNDVPYMQLTEATNGNLFSNLGFRSISTDDDGMAVVLITSGVTYGCVQNNFVDTWFEFQHVPDGGALFEVAGSDNEFTGTIFFDVNAKNAGTGGGGSSGETCAYRFTDSAQENFGGNMIIGRIPGRPQTGGGFDYGVICTQKNNAVTGVAGYYDRNVLIESGATNTAVVFTGRESGGGTTRVVDETDGTTTAILDLTQPSIKAGRNNLAATLSTIDSTLSVDMGSGQTADPIRVRNSSNAKVFGVSNAGAIELGSNELPIRQSTSFPFQIEFGSHTIWPAGLVNGVGGNAVGTNAITAYAPNTSGGIGLEVRASVHASGGNAFSVVDNATIPRVWVTRTGTLVLNGLSINTGTGTPEASVTAPVGSLYLRTDGGAGTTFYVKESGTGNTGWVAK